MTNPNKKSDFARKVRMAFLIAAEPGRVLAEKRQFAAGVQELKATVPQGDGHPVLVIPGFSCPDFPTMPLRNALEEMGYKAYGWEGGINAALTEDKIRHLYNHLKKIYEENGRQKISIIGHSLGGLEARCLAHEFPDLIRDVTTLGSPFGAGVYTDQVPKTLVNVIQMLNSEQYTLETDGMSDRLMTPPEKVPVTSIFSKTDGIGGWKACLNPKTRLSENIQVNSSHTGMICNKDVFAIILDRLAQPEDHRKWKHYKEIYEKDLPVNPGFILTAENRLLQEVPFKAPRKTTSRNNSARPRLAAQPS